MILVNKLKCPKCGGGVVFTDIGMKCKKCGVETPIDRTLPTLQGDK